MLLSYIFEQFTILMEPFKIIELFIFFHPLSFLVSRTTHLLLYWLNHFRAYLLFWNALFSAHLLLWLLLQSPHISQIFIRVKSTFVWLVEEFNKYFSILVENNGGRDILMRAYGSTQFGVIWSVVGGVFGILFLN